MKNKAIKLDKDLEIAPTYEDLLQQLKEKDAAIQHYGLMDLIDELKTAGFTGFCVGKPQPSEGFNIHFGVNYGYYGIDKEEEEDDDEDESNQFS